MNSSRSPAITAGRLWIDRPGSGDRSPGSAGSCRSGSSRTARPSPPAPSRGGLLTPAARPAPAAGVARAGSAWPSPGSAAAIAPPGTSTLRPVGLCMMRTAESVVLTLCPPGPDERNTSISRSSGLICDVDLLGLGQHGHGDGRRVDAAARLGDRDALDAVHARLVLQLASTRPCPWIIQHDFLEPAEVGWARGEHLDLPALALGVALVHLEQISAANSAASCPPVPARISTRTFLSSLGSFGISSASSCARRPAARRSAATTSVRSSPASSVSVSSFARSRHSATWRSARPGHGGSGRPRSSSACCFPRSRRRAGSEATSGRESSRFSSSYRALDLLKAVVAMTRTIIPAASSGPAMPRSGGVRDLRARRHRVAGRGLRAASTSWNDAMATSICPWSGGFVVIFCSHRPGAISARMTVESV